MQFLLGFIVGFVVTCVLVVFRRPLGYALGDTIIWVQAWYVRIYTMWWNKFRKEKFLAELKRKGLE